MTGSRASGLTRSKTRLRVSMISAPMAIVSAPAAPSRGRPPKAPTSRTIAPTPITAHVEPSSVTRASGLSAS